MIDDIDVVLGVVGVVADGEGLDRVYTSQVLETTYEYAAEACESLNW